MLSTLGCAAAPWLGDGETAPPHLRMAFDDIADPYSEEPQYVCRHASEQNCVAPAVAPSSGGPDDYFSIARLNERFGREKNKHRDWQGGTGPPYSLGLALAGGGTKASDYAMGVFAALHDDTNAGLSNRIEIVSSVSGGSYASLWYFSRLIDHYQIARQNPGDRRPFEKVFADCLPRRYASLHDPARDPALCPAPASNYAGTGDDHFAFQNHLRGYQDVLSKDFDFKTTQVGAGSTFLSGAQVLGVTALTLPLHWFARGLFDWKPLNLSLSARQYFAGIERTWALRAVNCERLSEFSDAGDWSRVCGSFTDGMRPAPNVNAGRGYTMTTLSALYYHGDAADPGEPAAPAPNIPFWVLNTTAGVSKVPLSFESRSAPDFEDSVFEFTPYAFGSRHYGYWIGTPGGFEIHRLAGASAAFLDGQQRTLASGVLNALAAGVLNTTNMNWGVNLNNPRYRNEVRTLHGFLPFPLSALHHRRVNNTGAWIHLSDGGMSENTGVWSLVRRGVRTIIVSDHAYDEGGRFEDVCHLRRNLARHRLYLHMPELDRFAEVCEGGKRAPRYDLWRWSPRLVRGCITTLESDAACADGSAPYFARLFLLKPALDMGVLDAFIHCDKEQARAKANAAPPATCKTQLERLRQTPGYADFPTELFGFLVKNRDVRYRGRHLLFPQHSTIKMTLNSSPWLYGAYRELARWHAAELAREIAEPIAPLGAKVTPIDPS